MKTLQECKDEVARKYKKVGNVHYDNWNEMFHQLYFNSKQPTAEIHQRLEEAAEIYANSAWSKASSDTILAFNKFYGSIPANISLPLNPYKS